MAFTNEQFWNEPVLMQDTFLWASDLNYYLKISKKTFQKYKHASLLSVIYITEEMRGCINKSTDKQNNIPSNNHPFKTKQLKVNS